MKQIHLITLFLFFGYSIILAQSDTLLLQEINIESTRIPTVYKESSRVIGIFNKQQILETKANSVNELLEALACVDVRQRGANGVQADISIRGGNFDQIQVLINGVKAGDPQTGHHNFNLPFDISDIERIEILEGSAARVFGTNAFSGAINIITNSENKRAIATNFSLGEYGYKKTLFAINLPIGKTVNYLSVNKKISDGYMKNTDFDMFSLYYRNTIKLNSAKFDLQVGYSNKEFGAFAFYTPKYPNQFEVNRTIFASAKSTFGNSIKTTPTIFWRRHYDRFELFRNQPPQWYTSHNYHLTDVYGFDINSTFNSFFGKTAFGFELRNENILSNKLGETLNDTIENFFYSDAFFTNKTLRENLSLYVEQAKNIYKFGFSAGVMINYTSKFGLNFYPGIDVNYSFTQNLKIFGSANRSIRLPSFTDLYYADPSHVANPNLKPEDANSFEGGLKFQNKSFDAHFVAFYRMGNNMIDWVKEKNEDKWQSKNHTQINTKGLELSLSFLPKVNFGENFPIYSLKIAYSFIDLEKDSQKLLSKYVLDYLKHKFVFATKHTVYKKLTANWIVINQVREGSYSEYDFENNVFLGEKNYKPILTVDLALNYKLKFADVFMQVSNLTNRTYYDFGNIKMSERWIQAGVKMNFDF